MATPWSVLPYCVDGADIRIVGFGKDYMLVTFGDDCPGCVGDGGVKRLIESLASQNVVFVTLSGSCGAGDPYDNHVWLHEETARKLFPVADKHWWKTQRMKSICPQTFEQFKKYLVDGTDLTPVVEDTSNRKVNWNVTHNTEIRFSAGEHIFATIPNGGEVVLEGNTVKLLNWGYRYIEGMSPLNFGPETIYEEAEAIEFTDTRLSFIHKNRTYTISNLHREKTPE